MSLQSVQEQVGKLIKEVPARRWLEYSTLFGRETTECMSDGVIAMVIVLNEKHRATYGSPSLDKYLDMGLTDLTDAIQAVLGLDDADVEESVVASFPAVDGDGGVVDGGVVADGPGAGVRAEPGTDLPGDGDSAV